MNKIKVWVALVVSVAFMAGCATTQNGQSAERAVAKIVAKDVTFFALREHPEWRPHFEKAAADLDLLARAEALSYGTLLEIVARLPVKELKSPEAQLVISDVGILIDEFAPNGGTIIPAERTEGVRRVVAALRDGIILGLR